MISVVIPTLLKAESITERLLKMLSDHPLVGEIIVFNNTTDKELPFYSDKINEKFGENYYVNPAWNYGVKIAKFEKVILLNDDALFDPQLIDDIDTELDNHEFCLLGATADTVEHINGIPEKISYTGSYFLKEEGIIPFQFGILMAFWKCDYLQIPKELKVYFGDNFLYTFMRFKCKAPVGTIHSKIYHKTSSTSSNHLKRNYLDVEVEKEFWKFLTNEINTRTENYEKATA